MKTIKDMSNEYESVETKNITELDAVSVDIGIETKQFMNKDNEPFSVNVTKVDGEEYRVPNSVLKQLKEQLVHKPDLKTFKVTKTGTGLNTSYTVIPL